MIQLVVGLLYALYALMIRPGVNVQVLTNPPPRSAPTDTGTWFAVGLADQGRVDKPILIRSMTDFVTLLGARVSYSVLYDALETFFREGGSSAWIGRVVGPAAVRATINLLDGVAAISLVAKAQGPGAYGNALKVGVVAGVGGGTYRIRVTDTPGNILETSPDLATQLDAAQWSSQSAYVTITIGASALIPVVVAPALLTTGADDRASITDAQWLAALALFTKDLGPGNVSAPGRTTDVGHTQLLDHAAANNRTGILDAPDSPTAATATTSATNAKTTGNGNYGGLFAPWVVVPGITAGTFRTVPPSALVAGRCAASDPANGSGMAVAGTPQGISRFGVDVSQPGWDDTTRDTLNTAGVNVIRVLNGQVVIYGWRSLADPLNAPNYLPLGTVRYLMGLSARAYSVGQQFVFDRIDGQGFTISAYGGAMKSLCLDDWNAGQIYGLTAEEAFRVDVGPAVNTPAVLAGNELRAVLAVRPSPMAELVTIYIVNTPITQAVA